MEGSEIFETPFGTEMLYHPNTRTLAVTVRGRISVLGPFADEIEATTAGREYATKAAAPPLQDDGF